MGAMVVLGEWRLGRDAAAVRIGRRHVAAAIGDAGGCPDDATLIVSELLTNAVDHGAGDWMLLAVSADEKSVRIEVTDAGGTGMVPTPRPESDTAERGRGLLLVAALASDWGVCDSRFGTTVHAELRREGS